MASIWVESLGRSFDTALNLFAAAVWNCSDEAWESPMWQVPPPAPDHQFFDSSWGPVTDPGEISTLVQRWTERWATPWSVAWHALEVLDYDLNGEFAPWAPPPPFDGHPHWRDLPYLPAAWSQSEVRAYIDYCRERVHDALAGMTDEKAANPLPQTHRRGGEPHAFVIADLLRHTTEHAAQIRQFVSA